MMEENCIQDYHEYSSCCGLVDRKRVAMRLDLYQLRTFLEATRLGSYTEAARRLHVTQSAVSHAVAKLEASAGQPLVEWRARRMVLTPAGDALRAGCERIFSELALLEEKLIDPDGELLRTFRIGAPVEFGVTVLMRKVRPLLDAWPQLRLDFRFSHHLLEPLLRQEIDLAIDCIAHQHPALQRTELFRELYVMVASPSFLASQPVRNPREIATRPVLSLDKEGVWWNRVILSLPEAERPELTRIVEINHLRGIIHAAQEGLGIGLVPKYAVLDDLARATLTVLFPEIPLLEDRFFIYQLVARAKREANRRITEFLLQLDASEFGDAIGKVADSVPR